jgi:hypothetical protein
MNRTANRATTGARLLGLSAAAALAITGMSAGTANAAPLVGGAFNCDAGTVVGDSVVFDAPAGKYVKDNLTLTASASAAMEAKTQARIAELGITPESVAADIEIPVVYHVIRSGKSAAQGNTSKALIRGQIKQLNKAYDGKESGPGVDTGFHFTLDRVTRTTNSTWFNRADESSVERDMKESLHRGGYDTLNIYSTNLADTSGLLGYAYYPADQVGDLDGVVMEYRSVPNGGLPPYDGGDTATHEIGHWLGLAHTFDNGCTTPGDRVDDTPYEAEPDFECTVGKNSCSQAGTDPVHNYMDYSDDDCLDQFTAGQKDRAKQQYAAWR